MKNPMFAQSRLVFLAGGESPMQKLEALSKMDKDDISEAKFDKTSAQARDFVSKMAEGTAKEAAQKQLLRLNSQIKTKIAEAKAEAGEATGGTLKELQDSMKDAAYERAQEAKIEAAQERLTTKIDDIKEAHNDLLESADDDLKSWVEGSISILTELQGNVNDTAPDPMATSDQDLAKWEKDLSTDIDIESETDPSFKITLKQFNRREEIRATDLKLQEHFIGAETYADGIDDKELLRGATEARATYDKVLPPSAGSDMSKWEEYAQKNNDIVAAFNQQKAEYITQKQAKQAAETAVSEIKTALEEQLEGKWGKPENSRPVLAAAKAVQDKIAALTKIEPKFGDANIQTEIARAKQDIDLVYNAYQGEVAAQTVRKAGGKETAGVYDKFKRGEYKTVKEFSDAFKTALTNDTNDPYATGEDAENLEIIEEQSEKLQEIAKSNLEIKEKVDNFVATAKGTVTGAIDSLTKFYEDGKAAAEAAKPEPAAEPEDTVAKPKPKPRRVVKQRKPRNPGKAVADVADGGYGLL